MRSTYEIQSIRRMREARKAAPQLSADVLRTTIGRPWPPDCTVILLQEAFGLERLLYLRTRAHALHVCDDIRIRLQIHFHEVGPIHDRERIGIGDREVVPHQILL